MMRTKARKADSCFRRFSKFKYEDAFVFSRLSADNRRQSLKKWLMSTHGLPESSHALSWRHLTPLWRGRSCRLRRIYILIVQQKPCGKPATRKCRLKNRCRSFPENEHSETRSVAATRLGLLQWVVCSQNRRIFHLDVVNAKSLPPGRDGLFNESNFFELSLPLRFRSRSKVHCGAPSL